LIHSQEIRDKISKSLSGRKIDPEIVEKRRQSQLGLKRTAEQCKKFSKLQKAAGGYGPSKHTEKSKRLMSEKLTGRKFTEEHKRRKSEAQKKVWEKRRAEGWEMPPAERARRAAANRINFGGIPRSEEIKKR